MCLIYPPCNVDMNKMLSLDWISYSNSPWKKTKGIDDFIITITENVRYLTYQQFPVRFIDQHKDAWPPVCENATTTKIYQQRSVAANVRITYTESS